VIVVSALKKNAFMRNHGCQGLFFGLGVAVISFALSIFASILGAIPLVGVLFLFLLPLLPLLWLAWFVLSILYAMKDNRGERFEIPFVTQFARKYMDTASA